MEDLAAACAFPLLKLNNSYAPQSSAGVGKDSAGKRSKKDRLTDPASGRDGVSISPPPAEPPAAVVAAVLRAGGLLYGDGDKTIVIRDFTAGTFLGSQALLANSRRLFSLQAHTDMTCLILTRQKFAKAMEQFPGLLPRVIQTLVNRINIWEEKFLAEYAAGCDTCRQKVGVSLL